MDNSISLFRNCMNCGDSFEPEHSFLDHICDFCNEQLYEKLSECSECGAQFHQESFSNKNPTQLPKA